MKVTVEKVSNKFGPSFMAGGVWYNPDKFSNPDFSKALPGAELEIEANGKYVKSLTVLKEGSTSSPKSSSGGSFTPRKEDPQVRFEIARGTAVKAAFGPASIELIKNKDVSEGVSDLKGLIQELTNYILTGDFTKAA